MATFITSKAVGESVNIYAETTTGYWQAIHDGTTYGPFYQGDGNQTITITNSNGEFTVQSCDDGGVSGNITNLQLFNNQITSFDGTGLSGLTQLGLASNQLTSFDSTGLSTLTFLSLNSNLFTSFDGTGLPSLLSLGLTGNQLTSFDGTDLTSLENLYLTNNQITSLDNFIFPSSLTLLSLAANKLTSFDGTGLINLQDLDLSGNLLTSLDVSPMVSLLNLALRGKAGSNPMTPTANDQILYQLAQHSVDNGSFISSNGRTSAGTADYDGLVGKSWYLEGLELPPPPPSGNGKLRIKGVNTAGGTTTTTTTTVDSTLLLSVDGSVYTQNDYVWYDQSSYGNNGVLYNGVGYSSDNGGYLTFDGSNDFVDFGNPSSLQLGDGTVSLWVKATSSNSGFKAIAAKRNTWGIFLVNNVLSIFDWGNYYATGFNLSNGLRSTGVNIGDNQWHNVVLTFTGIYDNLSNNAIVYLDGTSILTTTLLNYEQIYNVRIGDGGYPGQNLSGGIGQTEIYNRVFTSSEVSDNYNSEKSKYGL